MESDIAENTNTMATNVQTPYTTRSSAAIALTDSNEYALAFHGDFTVISTKLNSARHMIYRIYYISNQ